MLYRLRKGRSYTQCVYSRETLDCKLYIYESAREEQIKYIPGIYIIWTEVKYSTQQFIMTTGAADVFNKT